MSADQPAAHPDPRPGAGGVPGPGGPPGPTEAIAPDAMRELRARAAGVGPLPTTAPAAAGPRRRGAPRRRRRIVLVLLALAVLLLGAGGLVLRADDVDPAVAARSGPGSGADLSDDEGGEVDLEVDTEGPLAGFALGDEAGDEAGELDGIDIGDEWPVPRGGGGGGVGPIPPGPDPDPVPDPGDGGEVGDPPGPGPDDPTPDPQPADPCAGLQSGAHLVTTPDPKHLALGQLSSTLTIRNCGTDPVGWTATTKPSVTLDDDAGTLAGGAEEVLGFTIDGSAFAEDAIAFKIKVSEPGFNQYVDITAAKAGLADPGAMPPDPGGTLTTGGPTGCAASCITKAWLTPNASTPNLALDVETSTPASVSVFVSTSAPVAGPDGQPSFPDGGLIAATNDLNVVWSTVLSPLAPATDHHIIVRATDADGGVSNRVGTFRTITPAVDPGLGEGAPGGDSGCSTQCITKAWLTPDPSSFDMSLEVTSHTLARFEAYVSTEAPTFDDDDHPSFPGAQPASTNFAYETSWTTELGPLEPATTYHVIVKATDGMFRSSYQVGSFRTRAGADHLLVTFHQVRVHNDGDSGSDGELTFVFAVGGDHLATTGEDRIGSGSTVHLGDGDRWPGLSTVVDFDPSPSAWLPMIHAVALERDNDGLVENCFLGDVQSDQGHDDGCDAKWDVATSGLIQSGGIASLPSCPDLGVDAEEVATDHCLELESVGNGDDYPRFSVIVSVTPITA